MRPRRPPTSYFLWLAENREEIAKSLGTGKGPSVSKKARAKVCETVKTVTWH